MKFANKIKKIITIINKKYTDTKNIKTSPKFWNILEISQIWKNFKNFESSSEI